MAVPRLISARQSVIAAYIDVVLANVVTAVAFNLFEVPAGAFILRGGVITTAVFNSTSTDVIDIGDAGSTGVAANANRYLNDGSIHALAVVPLIATGYVYPAPTKITGLWVSGGGTPTTGAFTAFIEYIVKGRGTFAQGQDSLG